MRSSARAISICADVALVRDVADGVILEILWRGTGDDGGEAIQRVIAETLAQDLNVIGAAQEIAAHVEAVFEVLNQAGRAGGPDGVDRILGRIVHARRGDAVTEKVARGAVTRVGVLGLPVEIAGLVV